MSSILASKWAYTCIQPIVYIHKESLKHVMIMESQRRSGSSQWLFLLSTWSTTISFFEYIWIAENKYALSPSAILVLTTDSNFVATTSTSASRQRYFQRPEVMKECARQAMIQTPDFERLTETSAVTGRLRARESDQVRGLIPSFFFHLENNMNSIL